MRGRKAGFLFIDGFVREDMAEKLMQFFYSLKESDITSLDIFLEKGMPYTEVTREWKCRLCYNTVSVRCIYYDDRWL